MLFRFAVFASILFVSNGFSGLQRNVITSSPSLTNPPLSSSLRFHTAQSAKRNSFGGEDQQPSSIFKKVLKRLDTVSAAGIKDVRIAGPLDRLKGVSLKSIHGPITYLALGLAVGLKNKWCFRNPYYWFAMAFCVKWYRARYVFKIPVWDRQPNWNNIITSKEQEKDLKAFTCKNCGSTLFIAKTREFFFEGDTGIGGLGCFSCGAKGKDNFIMDRDRIVEEVADEDDYFEYERPLDFVSRAERRKLMSEAGGDEEKANQLLLDRESGNTGASSSETVEANSEVMEETVVEESIVNGNDGSEEIPLAIVEEEDEEIVEEVDDESIEEEISSEVKVEDVPTPKPKAPEKVVKKEAPPSDDFDLSDLGMDDF